MQGLNITSAYFTDEQGGAQFAYFKQFNASGGEAIMSACNQQQSWLRSTALWDAITAWRITNASNINTILATDSCAVHPVGDPASKSHFGYTLLYEIKRYREKLGTKAVREEFHGNGLSGADWKGKLLYGWTPLNTNVWLPSLSELVGIDPNHYNAANGCYYSAMQGLNMSGTYYWPDAQGGNQFVYFKQYNVSGGGQIIWDICNQKRTWLRSPGCSYPDDAWRVDGAFVTNGAPKVTDSGAVHPACRSKLHIVHFRLKGKGESSLITLHLLSTKRHVCYGCSLVNALPRQNKLRIIRFPLKDKGKVHSLHCSSSSQQSRLCWEPYTRCTTTFLWGRAY